MSLRVEQIAVGGFDDNFSYLISADETNECLIVDPSGAFERVVERVDARGLSVEGVLITHTHFDHIDRMPDALARFPVPIYVHEMSVGRLRGETVGLAEGHVVPLNGHQIEVLATPGHADDALCFYLPPEITHDGRPALIAGDTLFVSRCGRTDLEHVGQLYGSLQRLKALPDETVIYPGHDYGPTPSATLAEEKQTNPFLAAPDLDTFAELRLT